jgi:membrane-associated protease RseP (regulator of RpoE activity)
MLKYALLAVGVMIIAAPALAQEFFIVRGPDKTCRVVEKRPTEKTIVVIGDKAYVTREEAERQVKVVCKE